jgi:hypothetical protein
MSHKSLSTLLCPVVFVMTLAGVAFAGEHPYPPGKVSVATPDNWKTSETGDKKGALLASVNADESAGILVTVTDASDTKKAAKLIDNLLAPMLAHAKLSPAKALELNGMKGISMEGSAKTKDSGKKVGIFVLLLETPVNKALLFVGLADADKFAANKATLLGIIQSIKPLP